jgi:hypothetical protein
MSESTDSSTFEPDSTIVDEDRFQTTDLSERGRLQFFYHSPLSELPVRDVTNEQNKGHKTEPFIERNAENYCNECYQRNNIIPFLKSSEKYLFLFTTCKNPSLEEYGSRFIVGYLEKERALVVNNHYAVQGPVSLHHFEDSFPLSQLHDNPKKIRMLKVGRRQTDRILSYFRKDHVKNITSECVGEVERLNSVDPPDDDMHDSSGGC